MARLQLFCTSSARTEKTEVSETQTLRLCLSFTAGHLLYGENVMPHASSQHRPGTERNTPDTENDYARPYASRFSGHLRTGLNTHCVDRSS